MWWLLLTPGSAARAENAHGLAIITTYDEDPDEPIAAAMEQELNHILSTVGVKFLWKPKAEMLGLRTPMIHLTHVHFHGSCEPDGPVSALTTTVPLAAAQIVDGRILPFIDVHCDSVRSYVMQELRWVGGREQKSVLGKVLGRVVAHELYHVFVQTRQHSGSGLLKSQPTQRELVDGEMEFSSDETQRLRQVFLQAILDTSPYADARPDGVAAYVESGCFACHGFRGEGTATGPRIRAEAVPQNSRQLRARLQNSHSEMNRKAKQMKLRVPIVDDRVVQVLRFLKATILLHSGEDGADR